MNQPDIKDIKISIPKIGDEIDCTFSRIDKEFVYVEFGYCLLYTSPSPRD